MSQNQLAQLREMIAEGTQDRFYSWSVWLRTKADVLRADRRECQSCKARHRYRRADVVHHVKHLRDRPDLAVSVIDPDTGERQLISLCRACHKAEHPERGWRKSPTTHTPLTVERWD